MANIQRYVLNSQRYLVNIEICLENIEKYLKYHLVISQTNSLKLIAPFPSWSISLISSWDDQCDDDCDNDCDDDDNNDNNDNNDNYLTIWNFFYNKAFICPVSQFLLFFISILFGLFLDFLHCLPENNFIFWNTSIHIWLSSPNLGLRREIAELKRNKPNWKGYFSKYLF